MEVDLPPPTEQRDAKEAVRRAESGKRVSYYYDADVGNFTYGLNHFMKPHRMRMTHNLVTNYGLLDSMDVFRPTRATPSQLTRFHTDDYIDFLSRVTPETVEELTGHGTRFLSGDDCPAFEGVFEFCSISAGGSICAAERLNLGATDVAINWSGGLHHAKKQEATGFCYVNDIVLSILELLRVHPRVLYIDIDVHHGDGVEEAFFSTDRVLTASFHKYGDFFPGTGDVRDVGIQKGKNYAVNIPLRDGITDENYASIFRPVIQHIMDWYRPGAVVLQCGADSLAGDKLGTFNMTMKGHADCVNFVQRFNLPTLVVGGGGYTIRNVCRTWTYETGVILGKELDENLPYNEYLEYFGPTYKLDVPATNMDDQNSPQYIEDIKRRVIDSLRSMPFAPSVAMQEVPRRSLGREIGVLGEDDSDDDDELDQQINQRLREVNTAAAYARQFDSDNDSDDQYYHDRHSFSKRPRKSSIHPPPEFTPRPDLGLSHSHSHASHSPSPFSLNLFSVNARIEKTIKGKGRKDAAAKNVMGATTNEGGKKVKRSFFGGVMSLEGGWGANAGGIGGDLEVMMGAGVAVPIEARGS